MVSTFAYRDTFFQLIVGEGGESKIYVDGQPHGLKTHHMVIWTGLGHPSFSELRKVCDDYIDLLVSESIRASGDALCEICDKTLYNHPYFHGELAFGNERAYLRRLCDGKLVKL